MGSRRRRFLVLSSKVQGPSAGRRKGHRVPSRSLPRHCQGAGGQPGGCAGPSLGKDPCDSPQDTGQYQGLSSLHRRDRNLGHRDGEETGRDKEGGTCSHKIKDN